MFKKILRKLLGMVPKEFTFAKVGTGPNVAPPPQTSKPKVKVPGQGTSSSCFSPDVPLDVSNPPLRPVKLVVASEKDKQIINRLYEFPDNCSVVVGENSYAYGQHKIFQDDPQPIISKAKKEYFRDPFGKFAKKPSENPMPRKIKNV